MDDWTSPVDIELTTPWTPRIPDLFSRRNLMNVFKESDKNVRAPKFVTPEPISTSTPVGWVILLKCLTVSLF